MTSRGNGVIGAKNVCTHNFNRGRFSFARRRELNRGLVYIIYVTSRVKSYGKPSITKLDLLLGHLLTYKDSFYAYKNFL